MRDDLGAERARLRVIAFGRGDRDTGERAAAIEALHELEPAGPDEAEAAPPEAVPEEAPPEPPDRRRRIVLIALTVIVGTVLVAVLSRLPAPAPEDSLAIFDHPDTSGRAVPVEVLADTEDGRGDFRLLAEYEQYEVWGSRVPSPWADNDVQLEPGRESMICLTVVGGETGSQGRCTDEVDFRHFGLKVGVFDISMDLDGTAHQVQFAWGPTGDLQRIPRTVPPRETLEQMMAREPNERDLEGRVVLPNSGGEAAETIRWIGDYIRLGVWLYRKADAICMLVADPSDAVGVMASNCTPRDTFDTDGIAVQWQPDDLLVKVSPELKLRIGR